MPRRDLMNIHRFNNFPINIKNSPAFGKKCLDDNIRIRRVDGTKSSCNFVEYERDNVKDIIHIENLEKLWGKKAVFINTIVRGFNNSNNAYYTNDSHLYALEDERGDTLAIAKVIDSKNINTGNNYTCISYIQASPNETYTSKTKHYRGLGETLVSSIIKKAKNSGADSIKVTSVNDSFWDSSKLFKSKTSKKYSGEIILHRENFDDYISHVEDKLKLHQINLCG